MWTWCLLTFLPFYFCSWSTPTSLTSWWKASFIKLYWKPSSPLLMASCLGVDCLELLNTRARIVHRRSCCNYWAAMYTSPRTRAQRNQRDAGWTSPCIHSLSSPLQLHEKEDDLWSCPIICPFLQTSSYTLKWLFIISYHANSHQDLCLLLPLAFNKKLRCWIQHKINMKHSIIPFTHSYKIAESTCT